MRGLGMALGIGTMLALLAGGEAAAQDRHHDGGSDRHHERHSIPELDATTVGAIAVIVAGAGIVIARRRHR